jgi:hypothetical protein
MLISMAEIEGIKAHIKWEDAGVLPKCPYPIDSEDYNNWHAGVEMCQQQDAEGFEYEQSK